MRVERIRRALERYPERFRARIYTKAEVAFCETLASKWLSYAARFAAKEAFSKALGTGLRGAIAWREIEVRDNERSRPTIAVTGRAAELLGRRRAHVSLTHDSEYAAAVVVVEDQPGGV